MIVNIKGVKYRIDLDGRMLIAPKKIEEFEKVIYNCMSEIINSSNIRIIVLETWMMIEYYVRQALAVAFDIEKYECENLDPKYDLLPSSYKACIEMLEKLLQEQMKLKEPPVTEDNFTANVKLLLYYKKCYPDVLEKIIDIDYEYNLKEHPELFTSIKGSDGKYICNLAFETKEKYYQQTKFVKSYGHMNKEWFKGARKINNARNAAAHKYDLDMVFNELGFNGATAFDRSKEFCLDLIEKMCFISICDPLTPEDFIG